MSPKILGLALLAAGLVLAAAGAAGAQAEEGEFVAGEGAAEIRAEGGMQKFTTTTGADACGEMTFEATSFSSGELTGTNISYHDSESESCAWLLGMRLTFVTTGCHFTFTPGEAVEFGRTTGTAHLQGCTEGGIAMRNGACTITLRNGTWNHIEYATSAEEPASLAITITSDNIEYTHEGFYCGNGSGSNGTYEGMVTAKAYDSEGAQVDLAVT